MSSYIISLSVICALLFYVHGAAYFAEKCDEGKNPGQEWSFGDCGKCSCYNYGMQCVTCGVVGVPNNCTFERYIGAPYPDCCEGEMVCPEK